MVKWGTEEIPRPPMGQKPGGKWKHWGLPHFYKQKQIYVVILYFFSVLPGKVLGAGYNQVRFMVPILRYLDIVAILLQYFFSVLGDSIKTLQKL